MSLKHDIAWLAPPNLHPARTCRHDANAHTLQPRHVDALKDVARRLRQLPTVELGLPVVALVGAPNVGKSSLVNLLSTGKPEVGRPGAP